MGWTDKAAAREGIADLLLIEFYGTYSPRPQCRPIALRQADAVMGLMESAASAAGGELRAAVNLDHQPKDQVDAVYVSMTWLTRVKALAASRGA